jgi:inner membrane protein
VSIIDPLFTLPLLVSVILSLTLKRASIAMIAGLYALAYLGLGVVQHQRAESYALQLAESRGHSVSRINVQPTLGNMVVWKSIYENEERFYVDGIRVGLESSYYHGTQIDKFDASRDLPWIDVSSTQYKDIARFDHFANGFIALHPNMDNVIADLRYSMMPQDIVPLWGITLDPKRANDAHVDFVDFERDSQRAKTASTQLWGMITGADAGQVIDKGN